MANSVILNIASRPLTRLLQNSVLPSAAYASSLDTAWVQRATKLYVFYPRAWWTAAGLYNGSFEDTPAWEEGVVAPIVARYARPTTLRPVDLKLHISNKHWKISPANGHIPWTHFASCIQTRQEAH